MRRILIILTTIVSLAVVAPAYAQDGVTLSGTATVTGDTVKLVSDFSTAATGDDFGGVQFAVPAGTTLSALTNLAAVYSITHGDCGGGSPRFQIMIGGMNMFVYLGPAPSFTGCTLNTFVNSGNLVGTSDACRVDTSKFTGGTQCSTWAQAVTLLGSQAVQSISFVVDGGWKQADKIQTVLLKSVTINAKTFTFGQAPGGGGGKVAPGKFCNALRSKMGVAAFNELWSTSGTSNGMGKCASTVAHARNAGKTEQQILAAVETCTAKGLKGAALGACVAATDGVAATLTEQQEAKVKAKAHGKKGKKKH